MCKQIVLGLALAILLPVQAYDFSQGGIYYKVNGSGLKKSALVTYPHLEGFVYSGHVTVPPQVTYKLETMPVKGVSDHAFFNSQELTGITLPDDVTWIGQQAFSHCYALTEIRLPAKLQRIEDFAFEYCEDMTEFNIPASVTQIGSCVFLCCSGLQNINVAEENPVYKSVSGIVYTKDGKGLIQLPEGMEEAFYEIPQGVETVTDYAFSANRYLNTIEIGKDVQDILPYTFTDCISLEWIETNPLNANLKSMDGVLYSADGKNLIQFPRCYGEIEYTVPEGVESMNNLSMSAHGWLTKVSLPKSMVSVGDYAFAGSVALTEVECHALTPPALNANAYPFETSVCQNATLYVPAESVTAYKADAGWKKFRNIRAIGSSSLLEPLAYHSVHVMQRTIFSDNPETCVYDMQGEWVGQGAAIQVPMSGVYLVRNGQSEYITVYVP